MGVKIWTTMDSNSWCSCFVDAHVEQHFRFNFEFIISFRLVTSFMLLLSGQEKNSDPKQKSRIQFYFSYSSNFIYWFLTSSLQLILFRFFLLFLSRTRRESISRYWASHYVHFCCIVICSVLTALLQGSGVGIAGESSLPAVPAAPSSKSNRQHAMKIRWL